MDPSCAAVSSAGSQFRNGAIDHGLVQQAREAQGGTLADVDVEFGVLTCLDVVGLKLLRGGIAKLNSLTMWST